MTLTETKSSIFTWKHIRTTSYLAHSWLTYAGFFVNYYGFYIYVVVNLMLIVCVAKDSIKLLNCLMLFSFVFVGYFFFRIFVHSFSRSFFRSFVLSCIHSFIIFIVASSIACLVAFSLSVSPSSLLSRFLE